MQSVTGMSMREVVDLLTALELSLKKTFDVFPRRMGAAESMTPSRSAWGVQIAAGARSIEKATEHLKKAIFDAEPGTLL